MIKPVAVLTLSLPLILGSTASAQIATSRINECSAPDSLDQDRDGLSDPCELALAERFAPVLAVRPAGCNWEGNEAAGRLGGGYFFAAQPVDSVVRIAYLPAYFRDCGWTGAKCWLPWVNCAPHNGDSEFIVIDVRFPSDSSPRVETIFLSAHCFGRSSPSCRWYRDRELEAFEWSGAAPVIWVAEGRQANYPTRAACDAGHRRIDTCDRNNARYTFPVDSKRNLGSRAFPAQPDGCVLGRELPSSGAAPDAKECFWTGSLFRGWQTTGPGVTGYARYLAGIARF